MTETTDDSQSFTVGLTTACPTPSLAFTVTAISGLTATVEITTCDPGAGHSWTATHPSLAGEDDNTIENVRAGIYEYTFHSAGSKILSLTGENDCGKVVAVTHNVTVREAPVCPDVTASVTLISKTDLTVTVDVQTSPDKGWMTDDPNIDWGDGEGIRPVSNGHHTHTYAAAGRYNIQMGGGLTCGHANSDYIYVDVTAPVAPAFGEIVQLDYPPSIEHGGDVKVTFRIHNTGGETGTFIARLYRGNTQVGIDWRAVIHAGVTPPSDAVIHATAPMSGTSVSYTLKTFLET